ncbi:phage tail assembly chaperone [Cedecea davisae]|uniref:phage tail assembly chaperone n=1 Tax=Cedecea davisae TaxID=158484 RepID=UPI00376ED955
MEITLKAVNYRIGKLSVFEQLNVARKLLPVLAGVVSDFRSLQGKEGGNALETVLPKIARMLADLSEDDCNAILYPCLAVVTREHMKGWVTVFNQGSLSFDDIDLMTLLQLVARVVADSLGNFLQELPGGQSPDPAAA